MKSTKPRDVFLTSRTRPNNESYDGGGALKKESLLILFLKKKNVFLTFCWYH
jgi:hypothetical protein